MNISRVRFIIVFIGVLALMVSIPYLGKAAPSVQGLPTPAPSPTPSVDVQTRLQRSQISELSSSVVDGRVLTETTLLAGQLFATQAMSQHTYEAEADALVLQGYPSQNFGNTSDMWAGYDDRLSPDGLIVRSLTKFDLADLPMGQTITTATLRVYLISSWDFPNTERTVTAYQVTSDWSENTVNWNNAPGFGSAYDSASMGNDEFGWHEFDVTDLVAAWYEGSQPNYGIMLRGPEISGSDSSWRGFSTREGSFSPQLSVAYSESIPPPATYIYMPIVLKSPPQEPPVSPPAANIPCLTVLAQRLSVYGGFEIFIGCESGLVFLVEWHYDAGTGAVNGFHLTGKDNKSIIVYEADIDIQRDVFGRVKSYTGIVSGEDFPSFNETLVNTYNEAGKVVHVEVVKLYPATGANYTMDLSPCWLGDSWSGYKVKVWGPGFNGDEFSVGNCNTLLNK